MINLYLVAISLVLMFVVMTLLHFRHSPFFPKVKESAVNKAASKDQLQQLEASLQAGDISQEVFDAQKRDLLIKFSLDKRNAGEVSFSFDKSKALQIAALALCILLSIGVYMLQGSWKHQMMWDDLKLIADDQEALKVQLLDNAALSEQEKAERLLLILRGKLLANEKDADGWRVMGVTLANMGAFSEAERAFERALTVEPSNHQIRLTWVQILFETRQNKNIKQALQHLDYILSIEPQHDSALMMKAFAHDWLGEYQKAIAIWQGILQSRDSSEKLVAMLNQSIARAQQKMAAHDNVAEQSTSQAKANAQQVLLSLKLELSPQLSEEYANGMAFVVLKDANQAAPVAVKRLSVAQLALPVEFSDSDTMAGQKLSQFASLELVVRLQLGATVDNSGSSKRINLGTANIGSADVQLYQVK